MIVRPAAFVVFLANTKKQLCSLNNSIFVVVFCENTKKLSYATFFNNSLFLFVHTPSDRRVP